MPKTMRIVPVLFAFVLMAFAAHAAQMSSRPAAFSSEQRDEIVQILREALKRDPSILQDAIETLRSDQANKQAASIRKTIADSHDLLYNAGDHVGGAAAAPIAIVEFYDPRCPYCRQIEPMLTAMLQHDAGIRVIYKDLPILGPASVTGAKALLAAGRQGGYERLMDVMMRGTPDITDATIRAQAEGLGLNWSRLQADMEDPAIQQRLDSNILLARSLGIEGTPAFVVGDRLVVGSELADVQGAIATLRAAPQR